MEKDHKYTFKAEGFWLDSKDVCDWKGTEDGKLTAGDVVRAASSLWGITELAFMKITKNKSTGLSPSVVLPMMSGPYMTITMPA